MFKHHAHTYIYSPDVEDQSSKRQRRKDVICMAFTLAWFAGWGVLLAWRG